MSLINVDVREKVFSKKIIDALINHGAVRITGLYDKDLLSQLQNRWKIYFAKPSISGTLGYSRTGYPKAMISSFKLGTPAIKIILNEQIKLIVFIVRYFLPGFFFFF